MTLLSRFRWLGWVGMAIFIAVTMYGLFWAHVWWFRFMVWFNR